MTAILKSSASASIAGSVLNEIINKNSIYYYYLGKILSWNPLGIDDPELPLDTYKYESETRSNLITIKRILESDVSFVIPRIDWNTDTIYDMYDDSIILDGLNFYVITVESNVYKCISNNYNVKSTIKPTGSDLDIFTTSDGYQWKFMYNVPIGYKNKFYDINNMPVTTSVRNQFYNNGTISNIIIENFGSGYVDSRATIVVSGDGYQEQNPYILANISLSSNGFGYTSSPLVTITLPIVKIGVPIQATATATITGSSITAVNLSNIGYGYDNSALVSIDEPITVYLNWSYGLVAPINSNIKYLNNYYNVSVGGVLGAIPPTHIIGTSLNGSASLTYIASRAIAYLSFTKTEAIILPIVSSGQIIGVNVIDAGVGYTSVNLKVTGIGSGALLSANLSSGDLNTLQSNVELLAIAGQISYIKVENQGQLYTSATVIISGNGVGATATAVITDGKIVNIILTNRGSGYTVASAFIVGNGSNANIRTILSPKGGHGRNAILELKSNTLMFFSTISNVLNQGVPIVNDNRQIGILKSINKFGSDSYFKSSIGSACYKLITQSIINPLLFYPDLQLNTGNKVYYVVSVSSNSILISSPKDDIPVIGDSLISINLNTITPVEIHAPTIDKYSGNMIFIDNRNAFNTRAEQSVSLRTTIQF